MKYVFCFRRELRAFDVSVHIVEPGMHRTPMTNPDLWMKSAQHAYDSLTPELRKQYGDHFPGQCMQQFMIRSII